jgi:hypothetical protein
MKAVLFMLLVPGVHLAIPLGRSLVEKAVIHGLVFAVVNHYLLPTLERFENPDTRENHPCPPGYIMCTSGDCRLATDMHSPCS